MVGDKEKTVRIRRNDPHMRNKHQAHKSLIVLHKNIIFLFQKGKYERDNLIYE